MTERLPDCHVINRSYSDWSHGPEFLIKLAEQNINFEVCQIWRFLKVIEGKPNVVFQNSGSFQNFLPAKNLENICDTQYNILVLFSFQ